ncbi:MAG TPA: spore coat protein GerQ [Candidatus Pelethenecus faecipullorum]|uniref:Spore coat protein GerQ n=1 Tax=Candidatus Pelethenecus faecipullorum TaxID=2840900 RepID=A0A9D1GQE3_9MOLU|nr:spore coat protein GerQ [Candidatus Pelethenecus faecipullorum]
MNYYYPPMYPYGYTNYYPGNTYYPQMQPQNTDMTDEQSYIENILRLNLGKMVSVYMNFENSQWGSKIFKGKLEAAGKDHIIISDVQTNMRYLLLTIYLDYVTFDEEINYYYPYQNTPKGV